MSRVPAEALTNDERLKISAVVHQNYYMPDVFAVVEQIIEDRLQGCAYVTPSGLVGICTKHGLPTRHVLQSRSIEEWPRCLRLDPAPEASASEVSASDEETVRG